MIGAESLDFTTLLAIAKLLETECAKLDLTFEVVETESLEKEGLDQIQITVGNKKHVSSNGWCWHNSQKDLEENVSGFECLQVFFFVKPRATAETKCPLLLNKVFLGFILSEKMDNLYPSSAIEIILQFMFQVAEQDEKPLDSMHNCYHEVHKLLSIKTITTDLVTTRYQK